MKNKGSSGWHGESRRHSLARKGVKTVLPDGRRFDVSKFIANGRNENPDYDIGIYDYDGEVQDIDQLISYGAEGLNYIFEYIMHMEEQGDRLSYKQKTLLQNKLDSNMNTLIKDILETYEYAKYMYNDGFRVDSQGDTTNALSLVKEFGSIKFREKLLSVFPSEKDFWNMKLFDTGHYYWKDENKPKTLSNIRSSGVSINTVIKEWNNGKIPQNINDWKDILKKTNDELASGYWAYDPSRVEELRQIKFHAQNTIEKKENRIERYRYLRDKQRKGELNYEMADELEVLEIESEFW